MPYPSNDDLPPPIRRALPQHAQDIYRAAFNNAFEHYGEESARRIAWAAVKRQYRKVAGKWIPIVPTAIS
ncbi:cation transport regulator [Dongia mobilis]|uniref:Cation transport regulator n=1 Tax=Dongia mobilis TaxID=578943 RepID=A0A4R6WVI1_9PROT|nr:ChaB family protein [Dongia mobilis]TDQ84449.1 cation transport regulator [Dongia mobilis]